MDFLQGALCIRAGLGESTELLVGKFARQMKNGREEARVESSIQCQR